VPVVLEKLRKVRSVAVHELGQIGGNRFPKSDRIGPEIGKPSPGYVAAVYQIEMRIGLIEVGRIAATPLGKGAPGIGESIDIAHARHCLIQPVFGASVDRSIERMKKLILVAIAALGGAMVYKLLNSEYTPPPER
jgi:hypothetical protein